MSCFVTITRISAGYRILFIYLSILLSILLKYILLILVFLVCHVEFQLFLNFLVCAQLFVALVYSEYLFHIYWLHNNETTMNKNLGNPHNYNKSEVFVFFAIKTWLSILNFHLNKHTANCTQLFHWYIAYSQFHCSNVTCVNNNKFFIRRIELSRKWKKTCMIDFVHHLSFLFQYSSILLGVTSVHFFNFHLYGYRVYHTLLGYYCLSSVSNVMKIENIVLIEWMQHMLCLFTKQSKHSWYVICLMQ